MISFNFALISNFSNFQVLEEMQHNATMTAEALAAAEVPRIFFKILVMRANFGDFGILVSTSKFWKNLVRIVALYWDQFWKILTFEFC